MKNKNLLTGILEKLRSFLRPFYDDRSSYTIEEAYVPKGYMPIYSKEENRSIGKHTQKHNRKLV